MAIKENREYRNFGLFEQRAEGDGEIRAEGYASTFAPYKLLEIDGEDYFERIDPHAFDETDMSDVVFLRDHTGPVLARTKNGTIDLTVDGVGLWTSTDLSKTTAAREMQEDIGVGNYTQMSFSFIVKRDHFERDTRTRVIDEVAKLFDISAVAFPANPTTDIGLNARAFFDGEIEKETTERLEREARERRAKKIKLMLEVTQK